VAFAFSSAASTASNCSWSQGCKTALVTEVTPLTRTSPVAGRNKVSSLAPPVRRYSCGCRLGCPSGCQCSPGCGLVA
jgi:hypothetical protein